MNSVSVKKMGLGKSALGSSAWVRHTRGSKYSRIIPSLELGRYMNDTNYK